MAHLDSNELIAPETLRKDEKDQAETIRADAKRHLHRLRSSGHDSGVLPFRDLSKEVEKVGLRPFHAGEALRGCHVELMLTNWRRGSMHDIWKGLWLDTNVVALKVFREKEPGSERVDEKEAAVCAPTTLAAGR